MNVRGRAMTALTLVLLLPSAGCAPRLVWAGHDSTGALRAAVFAADGKQWLVSGADVGTRFDVVDQEAIAFSPDGSRLAYAAMEAGVWWIVIGPEQLGPWNDVSEPRFSGDGRHFAFLAQAADGWHAVVDGIPGSAFEAIQPHTLQFSPDGQRVALVARSGGCAVVVVDGVPGACRERVRALRLTNVGAAGILREGPSDRFFFGTEAGPAAEEIGEWAVTPDGARFAYASRTGLRWVVQVDGAAVSSCERVQHVLFGDDGRRVAWVCIADGRSSVVIDGVPGAEALVVSDLVLAAHARAYAYVARDDRGVWVVSAGSRLGPFADVEDLSLGSGGGAPVFVARSAGRSRVVHGASVTPVDAPVEATLVASGDGIHWALVDGDPSHHVLWLVLDGRRVREVRPDEVFGISRDQRSAWMTHALHELLRPGEQGGS